jgi:hypothetical protein
MQVTKVGTDQLDIDGLKATVKGSKLTIASETQTQNSDGLTLTVTASYSGIVSKTNISIKESYSGNWSGNSMSGTISGSTMYTLTK